VRDALSFFDDRGTGEKLSHRGHREHRGHRVRRLQATHSAAKSLTFWRNSCSNSICDLGATRKPPSCTLGVLGDLGALGVKAVEDFALGVKAIEVCALGVKAFEDLASITFARGGSTL
jgi:hypothetical protein